MINSYYVFSLIKLLYNISNMAEKQDRFSRILQVYKGKYKSTIEGMLKFVKQKVESPAQTLQLIETVILSKQHIQETISQEQLKNYLHLIAAAQANIDIRYKKIGELEQYVKIQFKSSKKNQSQQSEVKKEAPFAPSTIEKEGKIDKKYQEIGEKQRGGSDGIRKQKQQVSFNEKSKNTQQQKNKNNRAKTTNSQQSSSSSKKEQKQGEPSSRIVRKQKQQQQPQLSVIVQKVTEEDRTSSNVIKVGFTKSQQFFLQFPEAQMMRVPYGTHKKVQITGYDKFGQNYFNPIIKYRIVFDDKVVYRRYTQFQNLMNFLNTHYQGFILPELPPKQGIKYNLSYFRGIDEAFLNERQLKLQQMINLLMNSNFISEDQVLNKFLTDPTYEVESADREGALGYLQSLGKIAFNAQQLKTYGMAYFVYWKQFKKTDIKTKVTERYKQAQPLLMYCTTIDSYRVAINSNFDRRREIFKQLQTDKQDQTLSITQFDKLSTNTSMQVHNLEKQVNKYLQLKSQQSWLGFLINQKSGQKDTSLDEVKKQQKQIKSRIQKMQDNLIEAIDDLVRTKSLYLQEIKKPVIEWRKRIHP